MKTYIETQGTLTPTSSKTHIIFTFDILEDIKKLNIEFSYDPKFLDDLDASKKIIEESLHLYYEDGKYEGKWEEYLPLKNLLTLSIDDPKGFRGAVHNHPNKQYLYLSEEQASLGCIAGKLHKGHWEVTLSIHAVVTENCTYNLHIWEGE